MKGIWGALLSACALVFSGAASAQDRDSSTAVEWSLEEVKEIVNEVRAGRDLTPKSWPGAPVSRFCSPSTWIMKRSICALARQRWANCRKGSLARVLDWAGS